jgi:hypothetical protein
VKAAELDARFDAGEDIVEHLDVSQARRPGHAQRRITVDFPVWVIAALDQEAGRLGVTRQAVIKMWVAERLDQRRAGVG